MNPLSPSPALLALLGSAVVHAEEYISDGGHPFDLTAFNASVESQLVQEWLTEMKAMGMIPEKRQP